MKKGSLSGEDLVNGPPWSAMLPEAMLMSVVQDVAPSCDKASDLCGEMQSVLLPNTLVMSLGFAPSGSHTDVSGICSHLSKCWSSWFMQSLKAMSRSVVLIWPKTVLISMACSGLSSESMLISMAVGELDLPLMKELPSRRVTALQCRRWYVGELALPHSCHYTN